MGSLGVARSHAGVDRNTAWAQVPADGDVARSHAGVDRNSPSFTSRYGAACRPLTRGRGSKRTTPGLSRRPSARRPLTRGRGSKRARRMIARGHPVSPAHTRAWIETRARPSIVGLGHGRPLTRGRGSKLRLSLLIQRRVTVARSHAGVDRNRPMRLEINERGGSPAHTRAWIETTSAIPTSRRYLVARSHAGVDRNF